METSKIAVILLGQTRTYRYCNEVIMKLFDGYDVDYYCQFWDNDRHIDRATNLYKPVHVKIDKNVEFNTLIHSIDFSNRCKDRSPRACLNTFRMYYTFNGISDILKDKKYSKVIRCRYDLMFNQKIPNKILFSNNDYIYIPSTYNWYGLNDQFAIGNQNVMNRYFDIWHWLTNIYDGIINPEIILYEYLKSQKIPRYHFDIDYKILRPTCVRKPYNRIRVHPDPFNQKSDRFGYEHRVHINGYDE